MNKLIYCYMQRRLVSLLFAQLSNDGSFFVVGTLLSALLMVIFSVSLVRVVWIRIVCLRFFRLLVVYLVGKTPFFCIVFHKKRV